MRLRIGTIVRAEPNPGARDPAYRLWIDFGEDGTKQSSAHLTDLYAATGLVGRQVVAVTGLASLRIGGFRSDVLVLGVETASGVTLLAMDGAVVDGSPVS